MCQLHDNLVLDFFDECSSFGFYLRDLLARKYKIGEFVNFLMGIGLANTSLQVFDKEL